MSLEFYKTPAGRKYYEGTMPRIADALERLADVMEKKTDTMSVDDALSEIESLTRRAAETAAREAAESREYGG